MSQFEIKPFELTEDFQKCWYAAGRHLSLRVMDTGSRWLRADLPPFREHLSFALGNQLFFLQIMDIDEPQNGWVQESRLVAAVHDANGIGCLMPMKRQGEDWRPVERGWGLVDMETMRRIDPAERTTDEPIYMTAWEIHDVGVQAVRQHLEGTGWTIASWQTDLQVDPSIFAHKDGRFCGFVVRTSNKGPDKAERPANSLSIAKMMHAKGWGAKFVGLKIADFDSPTHLDPRLQHLTRKILRSAPLILSDVDIEDLAKPI